MSWACFAPGPPRHPTQDEINEVPPPDGEAWGLNPESIVIRSVCWLETGHDGPHDWEDGK